jgi:hypothetical protein
MTLSSGFVIVMLSLLFVTSSIPANESYVLSERIGSDIDSSERRYFDLFPNVRGFLSAEVSRIQDDSVEILIRRQSPSRVQDEIQTSIPLEDVQKLRHYLDTYESNVLLNDIRPIGQSISGLTQPRESWIQPRSSQMNTQVRISQDEISRLSVKLKNGETVKGWLISAGDEAFVLSNAASGYQSDLYDWRTSPDEYRVIHHRDIDDLVVHNKEKHLQGFLLGGFIGAITGAAIGFSDGDDYPEGGFSLTAEEKAQAGATFLGGGGAVLGFLIGAYQGLDTRIDINGDLALYQRAVNANRIGQALFPSTPPPEVQRLLDTETSVSLNADDAGLVRGQSTLYMVRPTDMEESTPRVGIGGISTRVSLVDGAIYTSLELVSVRF